MIGAPVLLWRKALISPWQHYCLLTDILVWSFVWNEAMESAVLHANVHSGGWLLFNFFFSGSCFFTVYWEDKISWSNYTEPFWTSWQTERLFKLLVYFYIPFVIYTLAFWHQRCKGTRGKTNKGLVKGEASPGQGFKRSSFDLNCAFTLSNLSIFVQDQV